jgi:hypothetical protein
MALYPKCLLRMAEPLRNLVLAPRSLAGKPDVEAAATKPQEDGLGGSLLLLFLGSLLSLFLGGLLLSFLGDEGVDEAAEVLLTARAQAGVLLLPAGAQAGVGGAQAGDILLPAAGGIDGGIRGQGQMSRQGSTIPHLGRTREGVAAYLG